MLTDLVQIRRLGEKHLEENKHLRVHLKRHAFVERRLKKIAQDIEEQIDCTACANCCRVATTKITERDVERLSKFLGMRISEFLRDYTVSTEDEGLILQRDEKSGCTVYEGRPTTCENFPHLVKGAGSFVSRMWEMPDRATYCPIVYNAMEAFKDETGSR